MKYILIIGDGMADNAVPELNGKTPLEVAEKPFIDQLAAKSLLGSTNPHTPAMLTTIRADGETKPASTAAVPTTIPPMVETD